MHGGHHQPFRFAWLFVVDTENPLELWEHKEQCVQIDQSHYRYHPEWASHLRRPMPSTGKPVKETLLLSGIVERLMKDLVAAYCNMQF